MRRFEFVGDGSEKFWEISSQGPTITVRFGRLGTNGQTQVKDHGTEAAALAQVDKLVAEKVKKGYVEAGSGSPLPAAQRPPATKEDAAKAEVPTTTASATPAASTRPDETAFSIPPAWARQAAPFRGRRPARRLEPDAVTVAAALEDGGHGGKFALRQVLDHPSSHKELVERARLHVGDASIGFLRRKKQQDDPVGAAVVALVRCAAAPWDQREAFGAHVADDLVLEHGVAFAAEVGACMATVMLDSARRGMPSYSGHPERWLAPVTEDDVNIYAVDTVLSRLRAHLAGAEEAEHHDVVARLGRLRQGRLPVRIVTGYLAPTEQRWVEDDVAALAGFAANRSGFEVWQLLLSSVTTKALADAVLAATGTWVITRRPQVLFDLVANVGPDIGPTLLGVFDRDPDASTKKRVLNVVAQLPTDEAFAALVDRIDHKYVSPAVVEAMGRFPVRAARILAASSGGSDARARSCRELLRGHLLSHPWVVDHVSGLDASAAGALEKAGSVAGRVAEAPEAELPSILVSPPWAKRAKASAPPVVAGLVAPPRLALAWKPGEQAEWAQLPVHAWMVQRHNGDWKKAIAEAVDPTSRFGYGALNVLAGAPPELARPHLARFTPRETWDALPAIRRILGGVGDDAVDFTVRVVLQKPTSLASALLPIEGAVVATNMASWLVRAKTLRPLVRAWLARHPEAAARDLIPAALDKPGKERTAAEAALRVLDQGGHRALILRAAEPYGAEARAGIEAVLDVDPLQRLPSRIPALPTWLDPAHLPQVHLTGRTSALPPAAIANVCTMLALSKPGDTYAGVDVVREAVDPASLAEMGWGLLDRWQSAGFPSKDGWVLEGLGVTGDDETVQRLSPLIRAWPGEGAHARAVSALDVLSTIGSDVALMHLHAIAEKAKFKGLKNRAREKMDEVAEGLGLSAEQLADRLVPDLGLDADGSVVLDYGPRRFKVGFDEQLKPVVADEDGSRRKVLPKPSAKDDQLLATAAYATFSGLKKDVKTIATDQLRRFERAMVVGRRWTAAEQRTLFIDHPLLWHLSRRLVWATFDEGGSVTGSFRVAEDRTLADVGDGEVELDDEITVGIAHPLHLDGVLTAWSDLFSDYEVLQPFPQLGRDTWALTDEERRSTVLHRMDGLTIDTGRILGLSHRGWERGAVMDGGVTSIVQREVPGGAHVVIDLDPGIMAGMAMEWKEQKISGVWISDGPADWGSSKGGKAFSVLDAVSASELLRDLEHLRG